MPLPEAHRHEVFAASDAAIPAILVVGEMTQVSQGYDPEAITTERYNAVFEAGAIAEHARLKAEEQLRLKTYLWRIARDRADRTEATLADVGRRIDNAISSLLGARQMAGLSPRWDSEERERYKAALEWIASHKDAGRVPSALLIDGAITALEGPEA